MTNENPAVLIDFFGPSTPYFFLSNFSPSPITMWYDVVFSSVEQGFAYYKIPAEHTSVNDEWRQRILQAETPGEAKKLGRKCPLRPSWDDRKLGLMHDLVWAKFHQNKDLQMKLYLTGDAYLQEGTYWNDRIWGVDLRHQGPWDTRPGQNLLGKTLMAVRDMLPPPPSL